MVHAAAAGSHSGDAEVAWLFAFCAVAQLGWSIGVVLRPTRWLIALGIVLNAACVVAWLLSRTIGLVGPLAAVEDVGAQDLVAAALGACATGAALLALRPSRPTRRLDRPVVAAFGFLVLVITVPAMAAGHVHSDDDGAHEHAVAGGAPTGSTHAHTHDATVGADDESPIVSFADPRLTQPQRVRATELLDTTRAAMHAQFPDKYHVVAAGYTWIGDGRRAGGYEHFVNVSYLADGRDLDPQHIESIVLQRQLDGSEQVVTAMYILNWGTTLADAPNIAGSLTPWHDHQNLCWDDSGLKLAGIVVNGQCRPGGTFRPTPPMMHVWLTDPPCGPFSGVDGHGSTDCSHAHPA